MRAPQASLATLPVLPAKGRAAEREAVPTAAPPAPPFAESDMIPAPAVRPTGVSTNLRMSPIMHQQLTRLRLVEGVSLNALILRFIQDGLDRR